MNKGVVLEVKPKYLIVLTKKGEFVKGKKGKMEYNIGQEIIFYPYQGSWKEKLVFFSRNRVIAAAAAVTLVVGLLFIPFSKENEAYAYVSLDSNPSIELALNKNLEVLKARSFNEEGRKVLEKVEIKQKSKFTDTAREIIDKSWSLGYLKSNEEIIISPVIYHKNNHDLSKKIKALDSIAHKYEDHVKVVKGSKADRKTAQKKGMSTGSYLMIQKKKNKPGTTSLNKKTDSQAAPIKKTVHHPDDSIKKPSRTMTAPVNHNEKPQKEKKSMEKASLKKPKQIKKSRQKASVKKPKNKLIHKKNLYVDSSLDTRREKPSEHNHFKKPNKKLNPDKRKKFLRKAVHKRAQPIKHQKEIKRSPHHT